MTDDGRAPVGELERMRAKYLSKGRAVADRRRPKEKEDDVLERLGAFRNKLRGVKGRVSEMPSPQTQIPYAGGPLAYRLFLFCRFPFLLPLPTDQWPV